MNKKLIIAILSTIVIGLLIHYTMETASFGELLSITYGYISFKNYSSLAITFIKWIIPQLLLIYFWGNYLEENLISRLNYILTRTNKLEKYLLHNYLMLMLYVLLICSVLYLITLAVTVLGGNGVKIDADSIKNMIMYFLYMFLVLVVINTISIFINAAYAVFAVIGIQAVFLVVTKYVFDGLISKELYRFFPISNALFYYNNNLYNGGFLYQLIFLFFGIVVIILLNIFTLKNKEVL